MLWLGGSKTANVSSTNIWPGSRIDSSIWHSKEDRKAYLFGGLSFNEDKKDYELLNDLWELDIATRKWKSVQSVSKSIPPPRHSASACGASGGMMIVFGGVGLAGNKLDDLWIFSLVDYSWKQLDKSENISSSFPLARSDQTTWCFKTEMIIFGGRNVENETIHEMWSFSLIHLKWKEMESSKKYPKNNYGQYAVTYPKPRSGATPFVKGNHLYIFGGNIAGKDSGETHVNGKYVTDLWSYDVEADTWQSLGGNSDVCQPGIFSPQHAENKNNWPGCRIKGTGWSDSSGNLWMFGGEGADITKNSVTVFKPALLLNDLWQYDFVYNMWIWQGGNQYGNTGGKYGDSGSELAPGGRTGFVSFNELGNFHYIFGGMGHDTNGKDGSLSDLWEIDVHKRVIYAKYPSIGDVFMIIFGVCALILLIVALSLYNKRFYRNADSGKVSNTEYSMLRNMDDNDY